MLRTKKLYYLPGLISLIGILIALPSFHKKVTPIKEYYLPLFMPSDCRKDFPIDYQFSSCSLEKNITKRKKIKFTLDEDSEENKIKMEVIRYEALKLKYTGDTSTVILITISDSISYGEFVSLFDMCVYDKHTRYASWDNKFAIYDEPPRKKKELPQIQTFSCGYQPLKKQIIKPTFIELVKQKINEYYSIKGYLLVVWVVLLISFLYFRKRNSILQKH